MNVIPPKKSLSEHLIVTLEHYFATLEEQEATNLHEMVIHKVEKPLIEFVLNKAAGNQSKTANMLGINRNTLRKKIIQYQINIDSN